MGGYACSGTYMGKHYNMYKPINVAHPEKRFRYIQQLSIIF